MVLELAHKYHPYMVDLRRHFHMHAVLCAKQIVQRRALPWELHIQHRAANFYNRTKLRVLHVIPLLHGAAPPQRRRSL